ncbi:Hsp20 family protein [Ramlibacter sp. AW1]|uniref:Hsp20 family protein n=1 Tax=Ramlibacter aurantiacus TaxID=2801330 RepID=A0A936ZM61_9BURK|nr:Hsp20 family protein [Ramlibacter aurantiacus]
MFFAPVVRSRARMPVRSFDRNFERFIDEMFVQPATRAPQLKEDENTWTVTLDVPGVSREDLSISVDGAVFRIQTRAEAARAYKVAYELPLEIDADATQAKLENGVLTLILAKRKPESKARQIQING